MLRRGLVQRLAWPVAGWLVLPMLPVATYAADVNITADRPTGVNLDLESGSTAEIAPGVNVSNVAASRAVSASTAAWAVTNRGSVSSTSADSINLSVAGSSVSNYGSVTANGTGNAINLFGGGDVYNAAGATISSGLSSIIIGHLSGGPAGTGSVTNAGTITQTGTSGDGVSFSFGGTMTNLATGVITGNNGNGAVSLGQGAFRTVYNYGTIRNVSTSNNATGLFLQGGTTGATTVINYDSGTISGYFNGVYASSSTPLTLTNAGSISSSRNVTSAYAIEADGGGTIVNSGQITSAGAPGVSMTGVSTLTNSGTITGPTTAIVFKGNVVHTLKLDTGSVLNGNVLGVSNIAATDNLVLLGTGSESAAKFVDFDTLSMQGNAWSLTGNTTFRTSGEIQAGTLTIGGNLTTPTFSVRSAGTLTGTGTITGALDNSGTIAVPAGSTLHAVGSTSFIGGSTFAVGVTPSSGGLLAVTGATTIAGGTVRAELGSGSFPESGTYTILTATGGVAGTFTGATSSSAFFAPTLSYTANSVVLTLTRNAVMFASVGLTRNETATGTALDTMPPGDPLTTPLTLLSAADAAAALDQLSGEIHASTQAALAAGTAYPRELALDRIDAEFAAIERGHHAGRHVWAQGFGGAGTIVGDGNAAGLSDATVGLLVGGDVELGDTLLEVFGGYTQTGLNLPDRASSATIRGFGVGVAAGREFGAWRLKLGATGSVNGIVIDRTAAFAGFSEAETSSSVETTGQVFADLGYAFKAGKTTLTPFGRLTLVGVSAGSYSEGGGSAALTGSSAGFGAATLTLGLGASTDFTLANDLTIHAHGRIGIEQTIGGTPTATHAFSRGDAFTVAGTPLGGTSAFVEAGISADLTDTMSFDLSYIGRYGRDGGSGGLRATLSGSF